MQNRLVNRSLIVVAASLSVVAAGCGATGGATSGAGSAGGTGEGAQIVTSGVAPQAQQASFLVQAAQSTAGIDTQKVAVTVSTTPADGDPSVSVTSTGEIDAANGRAHLVAEVSGTVGSHSGDATVETVYDGDTVYLKAPFSKVLGDDAKPWVKVTSPRLAALAEDLSGGLQSDPDAFLSLLEGAGGPVQTVGTEDVRGVPARHVTVSSTWARCSTRRARSTVRRSRTS